MKILVTGAGGFIGRNLVLRLRESGFSDVLEFTQRNDVNELPDMVSRIDFVFHLAGINRSPREDDFESGNADLTGKLCEALKKVNRYIPIVYSSSSQALLDNSYGRSKRKAEEFLVDYSSCCSVPVFLFRLPNVFGKWSRPNYNSVVATFCYNVARDIPVEIRDKNAQVTLVYIDDVVNHFIRLIGAGSSGCEYPEVGPKYRITVGELADQIYEFRKSRNSLVIGSVGSDLVRALYSTYVSFLPKEEFSYTIQKYSDPRGVFVEMLKTEKSGQFSYFTAHPGVTRGSHYHHTKTEKFLVIKGRACFRFRNMISDEYYELNTSGDIPEIVESVPGWSHSITNVGDEEMLVLLWANEIYDRDFPDTFASQV